MQSTTITHVSPIRDDKDETLGSYRLITLACGHTYKANVAFTYAIGSKQVCWRCKK